ncbi:MAG TPA: sialidase family protein [Candidatus Thermoplasmatota archaeon]|nr:sialidase family protein [Candidatus Thermoplasmatota archaeon]
MPLPGWPARAVPLVLGVLLAGCAAPAADPAPETPAPAAAPWPATRAVAHFAPAPGLFQGAARDAAPDPAFPMPVGLERLSPTYAFTPSLGIASDGTILATTFDVRASYDLERTFLLQRTRDGGLSWEDATPRVGPFSVPPFTSAPIVHVDPDTDRAFFLATEALMCSMLAVSDDLGATWIANPLGCGAPAGFQDDSVLFTARPRVLPTTAYGNVVYHCFRHGVFADAGCATSLDGGLTFGPVRPVFPSLVPCAGRELDIVPNAVPGQGAGGPEGTAYLVKSHCGRIVVGASRDGLTWTISTVSEEVGSATHDVRLAVDEAGHAYAFWIGRDGLPYLAVSEDGEAWRPPVMVAPPGVFAAGWPALAAGADGRIALAYYATGDLEISEASTWDLRIAVVADALADRPVLLTAAANPPSDPVFRGECARFGRCGVGEKIDMRIDAEGRPWVAFVDACNGACATPDGASNEAAAGALATLREGPRLRGPLEPLPPLADA